MPSLKDFGKRWVFVDRKERLSAAHCSTFASDTAECAGVRMKHADVPAEDVGTPTPRIRQPMRSRVSQAPGRSWLVGQVGRNVIDQNSKQGQTRNAVRGKNPNAAAFMRRSRRLRTRRSCRGIISGSLLDRK